MTCKFEYIGKRIHEIRCQQELSQAELAEKSFLSTEYICQIETGRRNPSLSALLRISTASNVSPNSLLYDILSSEENYQNEISELLSDCNAFERRTIYETVLSLKNSIRNNQTLYEKEQSL